MGVKFTRPRAGMALPTVYLETSVVSYLTGRASRDVVVAARQLLTREWWTRRSSCFVPHVSTLVLAEIGVGDAEAVADRLASVAGLPALSVTEAAETLADHLLTKGVLPRSAVADVLHVSLAAVHGMDYLVTWNCRHIANAQVVPLVADAVRRFGYVPPAICTPEELNGDDDE